MPLRDCCCSWMLTFPVYSNTYYSYVYLKIKLLLVQALA